MAIINIKESWERTAGISESERNTDRIFTVYFDEGDNPLIRPLLAQIATSPTLSIPQYGSQHPSASGLFMTKITTKATGPLIYEVTCNYSTIQASSGGGQDKTTEDPLKQRPKIRWTFAVNNEPIDRDIYGKAITNSSFESFDPPMMEEKNDLVMQYGRNEKSYNALQAWMYKGAINSDNFLVFTPGIAKCTNYEGDLIYDDKWGNYFAVNYEFQFRFDEIDGRQTGWKRRRLDEGYRCFLGLDVDKKPIFAACVNDDDTPVSQPVLLDGYGDYLLNQGNGAKGVFLEFETFRKLPFSVLRIRI